MATGSSSSWCHSQAYPDEARTAPQARHAARFKIHPNVNVNIKRIMLFISFTTNSGKEEEALVGRCPGRQLGYNTASY